ncbi:MAG: hypothetical protein ACQESD_00430 [Thermoplasmatota archaeon]
MGNKDLWDEYCSFYEKDFSEQFEYSKRKLNEHLERWSRTKTANKLCPDGFDGLDDIPVTTYEDYNFLYKYGKKIEKAVEEDPKPDGMSWKDYYEGIEKRHKHLIEDWIPGEYGCVVKTTGSTGESKWIVHSKRWLDNVGRSAIQAIILSGSEKTGETSIERGDTVLNMGVPIPYIVGYGTFYLQKEFDLFPSFEVTDNMPNMKDKLYYILKHLKKGQELNVAFAVAPTLYLFSKAVTEPAEVYRDNLRSMSFGIKKILVSMLYLKERLTSNKTSTAKDELSTKGLTTGGQDVILYSNYLEEQYGITPLNLFGSTEMGLMMGSPENRTKLMPNMKAMFMEFIDKDGNFHQISELEEGEVYKMIVTPFGSPLIRYDQKDLLRVAEIREDGMPLFEFESREANMLNISDYFIANEGIIFRTLKRAGWRRSSNWAVTKSIEVKQGLRFLMEKDWEYDRKEAEKRIYKALKEENEFFEKYVDDFGISDPSDVIEVEYLKKGAFKRYTLKKMDGDEPIGQYKAPKVITPKEYDIIETLRTV